MKGMHLLHTVGVVTSEAVATVSRAGKIKKIEHWNWYIFHCTCQCGLTLIQVIIIKVHHRFNRTVKET